MSSFIIRDETINKLVNFFVTCSYSKEEYNPIITELINNHGYNLEYDINENILDAHRLGFQMRKLNYLAYNLIYELDNEDIEFKHDETIKEYNIYQILKSLQCYLYQCSEGETPNKPLYIMLNKIEKILINYIISHSKDLDGKEFKNIYKNEKLRNAVAFAHGCLDSNYKFLYNKALMYPISYRVTEDQIKEAEKLRLKKQKEVLKENYNKLLFCGMGINFKPTFKDGVGNHRIRTHFINKNGIECFIEFGKGEGDFLRIDHALFNNIELDYCTLRERDENQINNYCNLERKTPKLKYTFKNILNIVNKYFECEFKEVVLDYYNIGCDGVLCESPTE